MKVMVLNNSGNVGKSFISRELFYSNMECDEKIIIEIETHNSGSKNFKDINVVQISGKELNKLFKQLLINDCAVIDVGASNIIQLFDELQKNDASNIFEEIDLFVVPSEPKTKQQTDTIGLIDALIAIGVPKDKIVVVFNMVENISDFDKFIEKAKQLGIKIDTDLVIKYYSDLHQIEKIGLTANQLAHSDKDYKALAKEEFKKGNDELGNKYADLALLKGTAKAISKNLKNVYEKIGA